MDSPPLRLYLIRHGETDYNQKKLMQGHSEIPINQTGIRQATLLARRLSEFPIDVIYSSDVRRAAMTAAILSSHTGAPIVYDPLWRERDPGKLVHKPYSECVEFFTNPRFEPPDGESQNIFDVRVQAAAARLLESESRGSDNRHVAVVSHGMVCASFLRTHFSDPAFHRPVLGWRNTSLTIADHRNGQWHLVTLGDASHLDALMESSSDPALVGG